MRTEGIFRLSGSAGRIEAIRNAFDRGLLHPTHHFFHCNTGLGEDFHFADDEEPHVVAGLLKLYLRYLPDPLMCFALYDDWVKAYCM